MLKVIKRVLRLSGDLSKRIYASFVFSFIDSIVAMFPVGAVFYTLTKIQNNKAFAGNDWLVLFGILIASPTNRERKFLMMSALPFRREE